ncbi:hypothetical protein IGI57_000627 [Enterococcus sp. DIV0213j]|jgi:uncharacterized membrane protein YfcA
MEKTLYRNGLVGSMCLSFLFLGIIFLGGNSPQSAVLSFFMFVPGLPGIYFSTKIQNNRIKWTFMVINYFLATYYVWEQIYRYYCYISS